MTATGVIPARYAASRFPGKPLADIAGLPMVQRVWEGAKAAKSLREVIVATDDPRIADACRGFGALQFVDLAPTELERVEGLEQLRALENGHRIRCAVVREWRGIPVDVPADVDVVEARLRELGRC